MRRVRWILAISALTAGLVVGIGANPTSASGSMSPPVDHQVASAPEPTPEPPTGVRLADGTPIGEGTASCPIAHLCLWEHEHFRGAGIALYTCATHDLARWGWRNRADSTYNNQVGSSYTGDYWDGGIFLGHVQHPFAVPDFNRLGWHDRVDIVWTC